MAEEARAERCPSCDGPPGSSPMAECLDPFHDPAPDQGERDGLAERLEARARHAQWDGESRLRSKTEAGIRAAAFREAAQMARDLALRTSTEGPTRAELIQGWEWAWEENHSEHCQNLNDQLECDRGDDCHWPRPDALIAARREPTPPVTRADATEEEGA